MRSLVDFINHGILPFAGRQREAERIVGLWRGAADAPGLQAMLLLGEAGIGKSRLLEEVTAHVTRSGGAVIHAKLYPEAPTAIVPLLARAIRQYASANSLLKFDGARKGADAVDETLGSVLSALRRLTLLRRTMLVIEDVHLLSSESLGGISALLGGLADEQLMLLCAARPLELPIRSVLERFLVDEIHLEGLRRDELTGLLTALLETKEMTELIDPLLESTEGNPLALRSALRGAIRSGALLAEGNGWRRTIPREAFVEALERNVRLLSEGMAAHLSDTERRAAERIACLGEVVAQETALAMIDGDESLLSTLAFKGIIAASGISMPAIHGTPSSSPLLAFTHSLLHRRFVEEAEVDANRLVEMIASEMPIYSIVPFQSLEGRYTEVDVAPEIYPPAIRRVLRAAQSLDRSTNWTMAMSVWDIAARLYDVAHPHLGEEDRLDLQTQLLHRRLLLLRRDVRSDEFRQLSERILAITMNPTSQRGCERRIRALIHYYRRYYRDRHDPYCEEVWSEIEGYCETYPQLRRSTIYFEYLRDVAHAAGMGLDPRVQRLVENRVDSILAGEDLSAEERRNLRQSLQPHFLRLFSSREELAKRVTLLRELEELGEPRDIEVIGQAYQFEIQIGDIRGALRRLEASRPRFRERGLLASFLHGSILHLYCRIAFGFDLTEAKREFDRIIEEAPIRIRPNIRNLCGERGSIAGALRGEMEWTVMLIEQYLPEGWEERDEHLQVVLGIATGAPIADIVELARGDTNSPFCAIILRLFSGEPDIEGAAELLRQELGGELLRFDELLPLRELAGIILRADETLGSNLATRLRTDARAMLEQMLGWLDERGLFAYMSPIIDRYGTFFTKQERSVWRARIAEHAKEHGTMLARKAPDARVRVTMLGTIEVRRPNEEPNRLRGGRLRTLLGLMVADRMLEKPLDHREFCRLAASDASEIEDARKTVNLAVHRLREIVGHDVISTSEETPRLNLDLAQVDLLDAHRLFVEAESAIREGSYIRALPPLIDALGIAAGEIPFPGLYDDFFEAAREDFENRVRSAVIKAGRGLLREGDAASAEDILRRSFDSMPDDEEIAELLCETLEQLGKRTEAQRVRIRVTVEA